MAHGLMQSRGLIGSDKTNILLNAFSAFCPWSHLSIFPTQFSSKTENALLSASGQPPPVSPSLCAGMVSPGRRTSRTWFSDNSASRDSTSSPEDEGHDPSDIITPESDARGTEAPKRRLRILDEAPAPKESIYVGNLFYDVTAEDLKEHMEQFGVVERVDLVTDNRGMSRGFAYVHFDSVDAASRAIEATHMQVYEGRRVTAQFASSKGNARSVQPVSKTLYLGNLSFEMTDRDLNQLFRDIDNVIDVRVSIDRRTGHPRGFAHAEFLDIESAQKAFEILKLKAPYGRRLRVDYSSTNRKGSRIREVPDEE
ncbi:hypothetical protein CDV55_105355 [Aspergillus turcosus]|uniref:RRM domain-containing protein n=1 Tax=Aspergillus turcosus TaxID=1245748 RepID=A0A229Z1B3_9EURO|nr:hypothetical protein CDV55_105355 [Aspergillus turcosus]RLM00719.1 hypothetical protein CFD26_107865 [Aspergillus turcosus]